MLRHLFNLYMDEGDRPRGFSPRSLPSLSGRTALFVPSYKKRWAGR